MSPCQSRKCADVSLGLDSRKLARAALFFQRAAPAGRCRASGKQAAGGGLPAAGDHVAGGLMAAAVMQDAPVAAGNLSRRVQWWEEPARESAPAAAAASRAASRTASAAVFIPIGGGGWARGHWRCGGRKSVSKRGVRGLECCAGSLEPRLKARRHIAALRHLPTSPMGPATWQPLRGTWASCPASRPGLLCRACGTGAASTFKPNMQVLRATCRLLPHATTCTSSYWASARMPAACMVARIVEGRSALAVASWYACSSSHVREDRWSCAAQKPERCREFCSAGLEKVDFTLGALSGLAV